MAQCSFPKRQNTQIFGFYLLKNHKIAQELHYTD